MNLVSWILWLVFASVLDVLLELWIILIFHWNLLNVLRGLVIVWVYFYILLIVILVLIDIIQISSLYWLSTLILWLFGTGNCSLSWWLLFIFFFHVGVKSLSFFEDFHQFSMHLITIKCFQNIILVLKLVLRLLSLFSSLLFLNQRVGVFRCRFFNILSMTLSTTFGCLLVWLLAIVFLFSLTFAELVFVIDNMHRQTLVWQSLMCRISWISLILLLIILWQKSNCSGLLLNNCWLSHNPFLRWFLIIWFCRFSKFIFKLLRWKRLNIKFFCFTYLDIFLISCRKIHNVSFV